MFSFPTELFDGTDQIRSETFDSFTGCEFVEVELIFDVVRVEEDQLVVRGEMSGSERRFGVVSDQVFEAL
jgi:hypothetical protein